MTRREIFLYFKEIFKYLKKYHWLVILILSFSILSPFFESFSIGALIPLVQGLLLSTSGTDYINNAPVLGKFLDFIYITVGENSLTRILMIIFGMVVLKNVFFYFNSLAINKTSNLVRRDLQKKLFDHIIDASSAYFSSIKSSHLISAISVYADNVATLIFSFLNSIIIIIRLVLYGVLLFLIAWKISLSILLIGIILFPILLLIFKKIRRIGLETIKSVSQLYFRMSEMFQGISLMKIFSTEDYEKKRFEETSTLVANNYFNSAIYLGISSPLIEIIVILLLVVAISYYVLSNNGSLVGSFSYLVVYFFVFSKFFDQGNALLTLVSKIFQNFASFREYNNILRQAMAAKLPNGETQKSSFKRSIDFKNVDFTYGGEKNVLRNVSLSIAKGSFIALVGPTGCGKTTIANIITGLYLPNSGMVFIDGIEINKLDLRTWRKNIGFVSQDTVIFNGSIKENIKYGSFNATDEDVISAAKIAAIHDFIISLPDGYETQVGERGAKLSGGQRQRIALARVLLIRPSIIILDEATSSLDNETERIICDTLRLKIKDSTIISIAHRLTTIQDADTIFVLRGGEIIEKGNHESLMKDNSFYKYLYEFSNT